jgi:hypothetical protein
MVIQVLSRWGLLLAGVCLFQGTCQAQGRDQSSTQAFPLSSKRWYVVLPATDSAVTLIKTKRVRQGQAEYVDIVNVFLPRDFVRQELLRTQDIQLLNGLFSGDKLLITMAVLPQLPAGQVRWVPISLDSVATRVLSWQTVAQDCYTRLFNYQALRVPGMRDEDKHRRMDFYPVIKRGNHYVTPAWQVLTDYFVLRPRVTWFPTSSDNVTINCLAHPFTYLDLINIDEQISSTTSPTHPPPSLHQELMDKLLLRKVEGPIYTFWSLPHWTSHESVYDTGAVEFQFQPTVGLLNGKYPGYFGLTDSRDPNPFFEVVQLERLAGK